MRCKASPATPQEEEESLLKEFILGSTNPDPPVVKSALSFLPLKQPVEYLVSSISYSSGGKVHKFQHSLRVKGVSATTTACNYRNNNSLVN